MYVCTMRFMNVRLVHVDCACDVVWGIVRTLIYPRVLIRSSSNMMDTCTSLFVCCSQVVDIVAVQISNDKVAHRSTTAMSA